MPLLCLGWVMGCCFVLVQRVWFRFDGFRLVAVNVQYVIRCFDNGVELG